MPSALETWNSLNEDQQFILAHALLFVARGTTTSLAHIKYLSSEKIPDEQRLLTVLQELVALGVATTNDNANNPRYGVTEELWARGVVQWIQTNIHHF